MKRKTTYSTKHWRAWADSFADQASAFDFSLQ
jgi:hypothetical protein